MKIRITIREDYGGIVHPEIVGMVISWGQAAENFAPFYGDNSGAKWMQVPCVTLLWDTKIIVVKLQQHIRHITVDVLED